MAQCLLCKATISDSMQYCENCSKGKNNTDESYLDQLLSSVAPSEDDVNRQDLYRKHREEINERKGEEIENMKNDLFGEIPKDYSIFSTSEDDSDMDFLNGLFDNTSDEETAVTTLGGFEDEISKAINESTEDFTEELMDEVMMTTDQMEGSEKTEKESGAMSETGNISDNDLDILDLINEINNTEELPPIEDLTGYDHHSGMEYHSREEFSATRNVDISDVFSDALGAVSELKDHEDFLDDELVSMIANMEESSELIPESKPMSEGETNQKKVSKEKNKQSFGRTLFGNIKEERSEEEVEALKQKVIKEAEAKEKEKKAKKEATKEARAQKKARKQEEEKLAKEEARKQKAERIRKKNEKKAQHSREIQELIDEIDANEGRINKVGASIIFAFFATIAVVIVVGTNVYSYSINIKNAKKNFEVQHYNEAYHNVYGIDIRDEDIEIYDKIMTVMYVNKQLNSYENYYEMGKYPQALDSLLKGLNRYEKYYSLATLLGIEADLNYVRGEIVEKLNTTFQVSEEEAMKLIEEEDQEKYSLAVYKLVSQRMELSKEDSLVNDTNK